MIRYSLVCGAGHGFDGWFRGSGAFAEEAEAGRLECPFCGRSDVAKALMAPAVSRSAAAAGPTPTAAPEAGTAAGTAAAAEPAAAPVLGPPADRRRGQLLATMREIRRKLVADAEHVGPRFAEEARRIHYGEDQHRQIYGEASPDEAAALAEEGIAFHPLPTLPDDAN